MSEEGSDRLSLVCDSVHRHHGILHHRQRQWAQQGLCQVLLRVLNLLVDAAWAAQQHCRASCAIGSSSTVHIESRCAW
jgi:hypothetical protein